MRCFGASPLAYAAMALTDQSISLDDPVLKTVDRLALVLGTEGDIYWVAS